jgi:hypothetical protein
MSDNNSEEVKELSWKKKAKQLSMILIRNKINLLSLKPETLVTPWINKKIYNVWIKDSKK